MDPHCGLEGEWGNCVDTRKGCGVGTVFSRLPSALSLCVCICVCVCVSEREKERGGPRGTGKLWGNRLIRMLIHVELVVNCRMLCRYQCVSYEKVFTNQQGHSRPPHGQGKHRLFGLMQAE
jgi:hypothetical protein